MVGNSHRAILHRRCDEQARARSKYSHCIVSRFAYQCVAGYRIVLFYHNVHGVHSPRFNSYHRTTTIKREEELSTNCSICWC